MAVRFARGFSVVRRDLAAATWDTPPSEAPGGRPPGRRGSGRPLTGAGLRSPRGTTGRPARAEGRRLWTVPLAVLLVLVGIFATGAGLGRSAGTPFDWISTGGRAPQGEAAGLRPSRPISLTIEKIKVAAPVSRVGLADDGSIAVPPLDRHNETGWYDRGPTPGETGPAIIVGHADTRSGPSVFHGLSRLRPGDRVEVTRSDRSVAVFEVDSVEHFDKNDLPAERVYGDYRQPGLRLITCGGRWLGGSIGYSDNIVAFASLVDSRDP